jgi:gliding motility-associated-like protein
MMKSILFSILFLTLGFSSAAQMTISTGALTPAQYVNNLVGPGITVSNVTYTGTTQQIGSFGGTSNIGFPSGGVVLSSGATTELVGNAASTTAGQTNVSGIDNTMNTTIGDLLTIASANATSLGIGSITSTEDGAILEFDFVPISNIVSFNFVFSSDEYLTYVNSVFNDIFGFFVAGPGISGPYSAPAGFPNGSTNLALVPGTASPITISTIHPGLNAQYYLDNNGGSTHAMNGFTTPIPITFNVQCGETYHFKFAVADCQDNFLSTAVFLQDGSFTSPPVDISLETANGTDTIPEACVDANVLFIRSACQSNLPLTVNYTVSGTAIDDVDFVIADSPITLAAGQDTAAINIAPIVDALVEGTESITITVTYTDAGGNVQTISGNLYLSDITPLSINETDLSIQCFDDNILLNAVGQGGSGVYTYDWALSASDSTQDVVSINQNGTYNYPITITDICLGSFTDTVTVIMNQTLAVDTMITGPATCEPTGYVSGMVTGQTGVPSYQWTGPGPNNPNFIDASVWQNLSSGWYYFNVFDDVCEVHDSVFVDILNPPMAQFTATPSSGCAPLTVNLVNSSQNALNYLWEFGNGQNANVTTTANQVQIYNNSAVVRLIAAQGNCADTAYQTITVNICGCMDTYATNYNPLANFDDGSCTYPIPLVEAPNVFTPNGDDANDLFYLTTQNATSIELTILNRWGNVLYSKEGMNPAWDGKSSGGALAEEGVYFYKYVVKGFNDQEVEGHGFLHLVRK